MGHDGHDGRPSTVFPAFEFCHPSLVVTCSGWLVVELAAELGAGLTWAGGFALVVSPWLHPGASLVAFVWLHVPWLWLLPQPCASWQMHP